jgi:hypothetical protein
MAELNRVIVNKCVLTLLESGVEFPVSRFDINFRLNTIPTMTVVPGLGRSLRKGTQQLLKQAKVRDQVQLKLTVDGTERVLFEGYISTISGSDTANVFTRKLSASIQVKHNVIALSGAPSTSYIYSGSSGDNLNTLQFNKARMDAITSELNSENLVSWSNENARLKEEIDRSPHLFPGHAIRNMTLTLQKEFSAAEELSEDLIKIYDPANLNDIPLTAENVTQNLVKTFLKGWVVSNAWESMVRTARHFFLNIIPFNTGVYIANPSSLVNQPSLTIASSEYISISQSQVDNLSEPIDGIIIRMPFTDVLNKFEIGFPPEAAGGSSTPVANQYYHYRTFPAWLLGEEDTQYGLGKNVTETNRARVDAKEPPHEDPEEYYVTVGDLVAKTLYAEARTQKAAFSLTFPYREDLMPGTIVEVENSDAEDMSFIGDTLYGMINATTISCNMLGASGTLNTSIEVGGVRNEEDNNNDSFTFDKSPLYEDNWVGIDLFGNFLSTPPDGTKPKPNTTTTNSSVPGSTGLRDISISDDARNTA